MTEIEMLMICMGAGFSGTWMMMFYIAKSLSAGLARIETRLDTMEKRLNDIDQRVCRIEGALLNKECCILFHDSQE